MFKIKTISEVNPRITNASEIVRWLKCNALLLAISQTIIEISKIPIALENMKPLSGNDLIMKKVSGKASNIKPSMSMTHVIIGYLLVQTSLGNISV